MKWSLDSSILEAMNHWGAAWMLCLVSQLQLERAGSSDMSINTPASLRKRSGNYHLTASLAEFHWDKSHFWALVPGMIWVPLWCLMFVASLFTGSLRREAQCWSSKPGTKVFRFSSIPMPWELLFGATGLPSAGKHYQPGDEKSRIWLHLWMHRWNLSGRRYIFNHLLPFWCWQNVSQKVQSF